uniref:Uncharacterized protein n=1 Tax=Physcomitrium patens TaxID=3218 RepID=A0A2K1K3S8_PHYPA|nr:hypothetical protein PHYPA_012906 [Physcomitrium patens]
MVLQRPTHCGAAHWAPPPPQHGHNPKQQCQNRWLWRRHTCCSNSPFSSSSSSSLKGCLLLPWVLFRVGIPIKVCECVWLVTKECVWPSADEFSDRHESALSLSLSLSLVSVLLSSPASTPRDGRRPPETPVSDRLLGTSVTSPFPSFVFPCVFSNVLNLVPHLFSWYQDMGF